MEILRMFVSDWVVWGVRSEWYREPTTSLQDSCRLEFVLTHGPSFTFAGQSAVQTAEE